MSLTEQQHRFQYGILSRETPADLFRGESGQFETYVNAYRRRLIEALHENYQVLYRVMGTEEFEKLAVAYMAQHPSRHPSIRWFGDRLAEFLASDVEASRHPALHDVARLEWAIGTAFDSADAPILKIETMLRPAPEDWPSTSFTAHPSVTLLDLNWDVSAIWHATDDADSSEPTQHPLTVVVWRQGFETKWRSLDSPETILLRAAIEGRPFAELCLLAAEAAGEEHAAEIAAALLRRWIDDELLIEAGYEL